MASCALGGRHLDRGLPGPERRLRRGHVPHVEHGAGPCRTVGRRVGPHADRPGGAGGPPARTGCAGLGVGRGEGGGEPGRCAGGHLRHGRGGPPGPAHDAGAHRRLPRAPPRPGGGPTLPAAGAAGPGDCRRTVATSSPPTCTAASPAGWTGRPASAPSRSTTGSWPDTPRTGGTWSRTVTSRTTGWSAAPPGGRCTTSPAWPAARPAGWGPSPVASCSGSSWTASWRTTRPPTGCCGTASAPTAGTTGRWATTTTCTSTPTWWPTSAPTCPAPRWPTPSCCAAPERPRPTASAVWRPSSATAT